MLLKREAHPGGFRLLNQPSSSIVTAAVTTSVMHRYADPRPSLRTGDELAFRSTCAGVTEPSAGRMRCRMQPVPVGR